MDGTGAGRLRRNANGWRANGVRGGWGPGEVSGVESALDRTGTDELRRDGRGAGGGSGRGAAAELEESAGAWGGLGGKECALRMRKRGNRALPTASVGGSATTGHAISHINLLMKFRRFVKAPLRKGRGVINPGSADPRATKRVYLT